MGIHCYFCTRILNENEKNEYWVINNRFGINLFVCYRCAIYLNKLIAYFRTVITELPKKEVFRK